MNRLSGELYQYQKGTPDELEVVRMFMLEKHSNLTGKVYGRKEIKGVIQDNSVPGNCWLFELQDSRELVDQ